MQKKILIFTWMLFCVLMPLTQTLPLNGRAAGESDVALPQMAITEVCFNPTFKENDVGLEKSADVLEYLEVVNTSGRTLDLTGWSVGYTKSGYGTDNIGINPVVQTLAEGGYTLAPGEVAVFAVYAAGACTAGYGYATPEEYAALYDLFCELNTCAGDLPLKNFFVIPRTESGSTTGIDGRFNLDNSATNAVLTVYDAAGQTVCEANYNAAYLNRNAYTVNFMYNGQVEGHPSASEVFNVTYPTPGVLFENQITPWVPDLIPAADRETVPLTLMEYNICATDEAGAGNITDERAAEVFKVIDRHAPDVLCLCEVNYMWVPRLQEKYTSEAGGYDAYGYSSENTRFEGKQSTSTWDLYNLILWKRDAYTLVDAGHFWCTANPKRPGHTWSDGTVGDFNRCINWVILEDNASGARFFVLCQHIDAKVPLARQYSTQLIARMAEELSGGLPVMMTGDWNANDTSEAYRLLMASGTFGDARYRTTSPAAMTLYGSFNKWGVNDNLQSRTPIDHCIISKASVFVDSVGVDVGAYGEEDAAQFASDHNATIYQFRLVKMVAAEETTVEETTIEEVTTGETAASETLPGDVTGADTATKVPSDETSADITETAPATGGPDDITAAPAVTGSDTDASSGGCGSVLAVSLLPLLGLALLPLIKHRKYRCFSQIMKKGGVAIERQLLLLQVSPHDDRHPAHSALRYIISVRLRDRPYAGGQYGYPGYGGGHSSNRSCFCAG